jgi:hypothetical protein
LEGNVPALSWSFPAAATPRPTIASSQLFAASKRLIRQVRYGETLLAKRFPDLEIDITSSFGMKCPGPQCPLQRVLSVGEVHQGWEVNPNQYTTKCVHCGFDFIPRFCVTCSGEDWIGSDGPQTPLWCELLSPWALHKEILNIVFENGVLELLSKTFRRSSHQRSVVFWNLLISFRLRGLPLAMLLTNGFIEDAFPPKDTKTS